MIGNQKSTLPSSKSVSSDVENHQLVEKTAEINAHASKDGGNDSFRVGSEKSEVDQRAIRLQGAVRRAGGNKIVSERSGVPISTLGVYLRGGEWKVTPILAIAEACDVTFDWLITGTEKPLQPDQIPSKTSTSVGFPANYVMIPRYDVRASAGSGTMVNDEELLGLMAFDEMFLRRQLGVRGEDLATVDATGDSMEPTIRDGDLLLIDTTNSEIRDGRIYVINIDGFLSVKRLQVQFGGKIALVSDNTRYAPQIVSPSEREPLRIVGRVVYQAGPVRS